VIDGGFSSAELSRCHFEFNTDIACYMQQSVNTVLDGCTFYRNAESASGTKADIYFASGASGYNTNFTIRNCRQMGLSSGVKFICISNSAYCSGKIDNNSLALSGDATGTYGLYCESSHPEYIEVVNNRFGAAETPYGDTIDFKVFSKADDGVNSIRFSASPVASSNKNTLDFFEEGTFTPVVGGDTTTSGQTYSEQVGNYQRIGRYVSFTFAVTLSAVGTVSGNMQLTGLPFNVSANNAGEGNVSYFTGMGGNVCFIGMTPKASSDGFYFRYTSSPGTATVYPSANTLLTSTTRIVGGGKYRV